MISVLPDSSFDPHTSIPLSDYILPKSCSHTLPTPSEQANLELELEPRQEKQIKEKRVFSWPNILICLSLLFLASAAAYLYWPQAKPESKITDITNSLFDISLLDAKQAAGGVIAHPNESGSNSGSISSSSKTGSSRSSKPHKSSAAIPKGDSFFRTVIGGSGDPEDDESEDEDPNRKKRAKQNQDNIYSDAEEKEEEEEEEDSEEDLLEDEDSEETNWLLPPQSANTPNVAASLP